MKKAVIFTDDSGVKLPEIHKWKHVLGKGNDIKNNPMFLDALKKASLYIPEGDIGVEDRYRKALREFIRPALLMFAGMFGEIRIFYNVLKEILPTELYIVSGRYGIVREDDEIIPYSAHIKNIEDLEKLNSRTKFVNTMFEASKDNCFIIMCFPSYYFQYLINEGWFERFGNEHLFFIVTGVKIKSKLSSYPTINMFEKRGVARIGRDYQMEIIDRIKSKIKFEMKS
ncbi:hypothetical protein METP3_01005 [Methanosarcinales archaeon]|nr:hypothetical protein METP3_01005 [Methanosarcinales archaeon]